MACHDTLSTETRVALLRLSAHNQEVPSWGSYSYVYGPLVALCVIGLMMLVLRWAFGGAKSSVVERPPRRGRDRPVRVARPGRLP